MYMYIYIYICTASRLPTCSAKEMLFQSPKTLSEAAQMPSMQAELEIVSELFSVEDNKSNHEQKQASYLKKKC